MTQKIIIELYDKFFRTAFPKVTEKLGIVYTPVEIVDFIIHSVEDVLQKEFGRSMTDENVHILDPFTRTGTFITRLLQSGIIKKREFDSFCRDSSKCQILEQMPYISLEKRVFGCFSMRIQVYKLGFLVLSNSR